MSALRVLVAEDEAVAAKFVQHTLTKAGYEVVVVPDGIAAKRHLESGEFFAALIDWMLPNLDGIEIVRGVTKRPKRPFTILTSVIDIPSARAYALAAGADDFLAKPVAGAKLLELLKAHHLTEARPPDEGHPLVRAAAWAKLPAIFAEPVGALLSLEAKGEAVPELVGATHFISCTLTDASRGCELVFTTMASEGEARFVARTMLGEDMDGPELDDCLAEVVNVAIGIVKSAFTKEGFTFTLSLPGKVAKVDVDKSRTTAIAHTAMRIGFPGGGSLGMSVAVRATDALTVKVEDLKEGHILAEDVRTASGGLLVPACTRITESAAKRLRESLKGKTVRVCAPPSQQRTAA